MEKILFDTDIGSDIDDSYCLAYLLSHPDCELMGVTTVSGEPMIRAQMVDSICKVANKKIPIYCGSSEPMTANKLQTTAKQKTALVNWPHEKSFPYGAVEFLNRVIRGNPGEITLLAVGPMTNIAILFTQYPDVPKLLKKLILVNGAFFAEGQQFRPMGEWNVRCDVRASQLVYEAPAPEVMVISMDTAMNLTMNQDEIRENFTSPILKIVEEYSRVWFSERPITGFGDPLAAMVIFEPEVCTWRRGHADVKLLPDGGGLTTLAECAHGPHLVADTVDRNRFFERYFAITRG